MKGSIARRLRSFLLATTTDGLAGSSSDELEAESSVSSSSVARENLIWVLLSPGGFWLSALCVWGVQVSWEAMVGPLIPRRSSSCFSALVASDNAALINLLAASLSNCKFSNQIVSHRRNLDIAHAYDLIVAVLVCLAARSSLSCKSRILFARLLRLHGASPDRHLWSEDML